MHVSNNCTLCNWAADFDRLRNGILIVVAFGPYLKAVLIFVAVSPGIVCLGFQTYTNFSYRRGPFQEKILSHYQR